MYQYKLINVLCKIGIHYFVSILPTIKHKQKMCIYCKKIKQY